MILTRTAYLSICIEMVLRITYAVHLPAISDMMYPALPSHKFMCRPSLRGLRSCDQNAGTALYRWQLAGLETSTPRPR